MSKNQDFSTGNFGSQSSGSTSGTGSSSSAGSTSGVGSASGAGSSQGSESSGMGGRMNDIRDRATDMATQASEKLSDMSTQARDIMNQRIGQVREQMGDMDMSQAGEQLKTMTRENPMQALLVAAGVGFALGMLLRPTR